MVITTDIQLKGKEWRLAVEKYSNIFAERTNYDVFMLALPIGIMYDSRIEKFEEEDKNLPSLSVPRNVIRNHDNGKLDMFFQVAILTTQTENLVEDDRLEIAFADKTDFAKMNFLIEFANFGITKLVDLIGDTDIETMDNLKSFLTSTVEGNNLDILKLSEDLLLDL